MAWAEQGCDNQLHNPNISFQNKRGLEEMGGGGKFGNFLETSTTSNVRENCVLRCEGEGRGRFLLANRTSDSTNRKRARDPKVETPIQQLHPARKGKFDQI